MKVTIWVDMEGVAGICVWPQVMGGAERYEEGRRLLTGEVNAAVRGAKAAGATEIVVLDCHGAGGAYTFNSFLPDRLERGAEYVSGHAWLRYTEPLEDCDAALMVGFHAMAGTPDGVLSHTISTEALYNAYINDTLVGEAGLCAAVCGIRDVPCLLVTGDTATCREARELLGEGIVEAPVKVGLGRYAARHMAHADACDLIEAKAKEALSDLSRVKPYKPDEPAAVRFELATAEDAKRYTAHPAVQREGDRVVISRAGTFKEAWDQIWNR
ncbi:MAG: M55 family metallopeptidase [Armatimonadetes bacterium]|nr:M55 family metallopeptidase [Armatimonadota bacterium]